MNEQQIYVVKRNGRGKVPLDIEKIHEMVEYACEDITGVSASEVEMNSGLQFHDGISTQDIQQILIKSAANLISLEKPNYQYVAARLLLFGLRKSINRRLWDHPHIFEQVQKGVKLGVYDKDLLKWYDKRDWDRMEQWIVHERDYEFTYAGLRQVIDKYLVQDRSSGDVFETPQFMYMLISATVFSNYPKDTRLTYIKKYYRAISKHLINIPTPVMAGVRTPLRQYASCVLVDSADTLESIFTSDMAIGRYVAQRAGIGINAGGVRGGSATVHFPIWHQEIQDILVLKNNKGSDDNRVRKLDYSIQLSKLFYERFIKNEDITLFSPHEVPELYENWGTDKFDELYVAAERKTSVYKEKVNAQDLFMSVLKERAETGRIYIMNIDHCNTHSSFKDLIRMSNLCQEITLPTEPLQHIDGEGEIALCILSAINIGKLVYYDDLESLCDLSVRALDEIIDHQGYPVKAAEVSTKARRSLGIGYIGLAHYLAKSGFKYDEQGAWDAVDELTEHFQYYLLKASNTLAKEKGKCEYFHRTKYSDGVLPIDTYKKEVDEIVNRKLTLDWESLRKEITEHGLRHSTLSAQMPSESSSVVSNATNGIEPPRDFLSVKKSKQGPLKQVVPQYLSLKSKYTLLWSMGGNTGYINIVAVMQKYFDQAISGNWSYNPEDYEENQVPLSVMAQDLLTTYKLGWKTSYYQNTYDGKIDEDDKPDVLEDDSTYKEEELTEEEECESCTI